MGPDVTMSAWYAIWPANGPIRDIPQRHPGETLGRYRSASQPGHGRRGRRTGRRRMGEIMVAEQDGVAEQEPIGATIRVVLVDDHLAFRQALAFVLLREPDITIIGQAGTVAEARPLLPEADIAL